MSDYTGSLPGKYTVSRKTTILLKFIAHGRSKGFPIFKTAITEASEKCRFMAWNSRPFRRLISLLSLHPATTFPPRSFTTTSDAHLRPALNRFQTPCTRMGARPPLRIKEPSPLPAPSTSHPKRSSSWGSVSPVGSYSGSRSRRPFWR